MPPADRRLRYGRIVPSKPRSHDLERLSRNRFEGLLPTWLVFREKDRDYGIDGECEEFDERDKATGLIFLVQLKATDESNLATALSVSLSREHLTYYRNLSLPVLMVRYVATSGTFYTRWVHSYDSYGTDPTSKSITFRWDEGDAWAEGRPRELVAEARAFLALRSPGLAFPLDVHPDLEPPESWGITAREIQLALRREIERRSDLVRMASGEPPPGAGRLIVRPDRIAVEFGRVTAATFHIDDLFRPQGAQALARDLLALCALAFEHFGQLRAAGLLALTYLPSSVVLLNQEGVWALSAAMVTSRQVIDALTLAQHLDEDEDENSQQASLFFLMVPLHHAATLSEYERLAYRDSLDRRIERRKQRGELAAAARETMNLAQFNLATGDPGSAVELHRRVAELDPEYEQRVHYHRERAGALFLVAHDADMAARYESVHQSPVALWGEVVAAYERTVAMSDDPRDRALLADALMYSGRYREALDVFTAFNEQNTSSEARDDEWRLKQVTLAEIVEERGIDRQERQPFPAEQRAETTKADALEQLLRLDALGPLAWFNLGICYASLGEEEAAAIAFLAAGLITEWDAEAWSRAFTLFFSTGQFELLPPLLTTGERMTGGRMVPAIVEYVNEQDDAAFRDSFLSALDDQIQRLPQDPCDGTTIRMLKPNGEVQIVTVPGPSRPREAPSEATNAAIPKVPRNQPCPCGSGEKYKKCHGA